MILVSDAFLLNDAVSARYLAEKGIELLRDPGDLHLSKYERKLYPASTSEILRVLRSGKYPRGSSSLVLCCPSLHPDFAAANGETLSFEFVRGLDRVWERFDRIHPEVTIGTPVKGKPFSVDEFGRHCTRTERVSYEMLDGFKTSLAQLAASGHRFDAFSIEEYAGRLSEEAALMQQVGGPPNSPYFPLMARTESERSCRQPLPPVRATVTVCDVDANIVPLDPHSTASRNCAVNPLPFVNYFMYAPVMGTPLLKKSVFKPWKK